MPDNIFEGKSEKQDFDRESVPKLSAGEQFVFHQSFLKPGDVKDRHIDGIIIQTGLSTDLPDGTTWTKAYFATDNNKLYIWNSVTETWKSVTLT